MNKIKIKNKKLLGELQKRVSLRLKRKITHQETMNYCMMFVNQNFEEFGQFIDKIPLLDAKRVKEIIKARNKLKHIDYIVENGFINKDDENIYF
ncbi:MAG: hypothetical protein ACTSRH_05420 [Promethearchaeota archaeon]